MKTKDFLKEVWKQNKWSYLYSCIALSVLCLYTLAKFKSPLHITIPLGCMGMFVLMYGTAFMIGGKD